MAKSHHPQPTDPPYLKAAFVDLGLSEIKGKLHEPRVLEMFVLAGHPEIKNDETAWCAAAVGAWLVRGGEKPTGSLMARSYEKWGRTCSISKPIPRGAICVWPRGDLPHGHVNICLEDLGDTLVCIGGNQGNGQGGGVTISREGRDNLVTARLPRNLSPVPLPKPKSKPAPKPEPLPPPPDIDPAPPDDPGEETVTPEVTKPGVFRRIRNWMSGLGITSLFSTIAYYQWEILAVLFGFAFLVLVVFIVVIGPKRIRQRSQELWDKHVRGE